MKAPEISVDSDGYVKRVKARVLELVEVLGDPKRLFEVGLRAASCLEQHHLALEGCKAAGMKRTSSVIGAFEQDMVPVGTMGHEHVQRYGSDDAAFRAMTERRPQRSSYLLDTFDTMASGIPAALALMAERQPAGDSIRYDSGDKEPQFRFACQRARELGLRPVHILEDGFDLAQTKRFEQLRVEEGVGTSEQVYGFGGYLVAQTSGSPLTRDRVSAVYKLSQTGSRATMKFANEAGSGKQSVPGRPVLFRRAGKGDLPIGIVGQEGEQPPPGYFLLTGNADAPASPAGEGLGFSPATKALMDACHVAAFGKGKS
jgi:nicotinic acid phosphoribosyltransferase